MPVAVQDPLDANTRRFLGRVGRPLPVLADPSAATAPRAAGGPDLLRLRTLAGDLRQHTLDHLDRYLAQACAAIAAAGGHVHHAVDAAAARQLIAAVTGSAAATVLASPTVDEIGLVPVAGGGTTCVVGAAFVVAETGQVCLASDDPRSAGAADAGVLVCVAGLEAVVPRMADLAVMLKLFARAATGRPMTAYTTLLGPGPGRAFHLVLVDNGRTELLAGPHRPVLRCIGCGACTRVCPVYRTADVAPAGLWAGPVGAIVLPLLRRDRSTVELPHASTLCGACADACPVRIDLPAHLTALRSASPRLTVRLRLWGWAMLSPARFRWATRLRRLRHDRFWPRPPRSFHDRWRQRR